MTDKVDDKSFWLLAIAVIIGDGAFVVLQVPSPTFGGFGLTPMPLLAIETLVYFAAGFIFYLLRLYSVKPLYWGSCFMCVLTLLVYYFNAYPPELSLLLEGIAYATLALLNLCWGVSFASIKPSLSITLVTGAYLVWSIFTLVFSYISGTPVGNVLQVALPILSVFLLGYCLRMFDFGSKQKRSDESKTSERSFSLTPFALITLAASLVFSFIFGSLMQIDSFHDSPNYIVEPSTHIISILLTIAVLVLSLRRKLGIVYRAMWIVLGVLVTLLIARIVFPDQLLFVVGIPTILYNFFGMFVWIALAWEGYESRINSLSIFALGLGSMRLGSLGGRGLALGVYEYFGLDRVVIDVYSAVCLWALFLGSVLAIFFVIRRQNIETIYVNEPALVEKQEESFDDMNVLENRFSRAVSEKGLTDREKQILFMYSQGRSAPYIAEELFLSNYTVKTHIRRGFTKLDIHSRQELIDLII